MLLPRTRLAYVHLPNLLTDAKRDRSARVSGYVAIWLPEEFLVLYLLKGELVNAVVSDGKTFQDIAINAAVERVPAEPEYGEICFHEAEYESLSCMFASQTRAPIPWPAELRPSDPASLFPYLMSTIFDGMVEITAEGDVNYLQFRNGAVQSVYLSGTSTGSTVDRVRQLFTREHRALNLSVKRWDVPGELPVQAPTGLVQAYRDLATSLVLRMVADGRESAPTIAEQARQNLLPVHPVLEGISFNGRPPRAVVADAEAVTNAMAALVNEVLWTVAGEEGSGPEDLLREITHERRHLFQSSGLFDRLSWKLA